MKWSEAKTRALETWAEVQDEIGTVPVEQLLRDINAMSALCDRAGEEAPGGDRCLYCAAYRQFGGCSEITALMSHHAAEKNWDKVRAMAAAFMARLQSLEVPEEN